jgi:hypothetical protein
MPFLKCADALLAFIHLDDPRLSSHRLNVLAPM